jgi:Flp pilus assembly secretin CpaC
MGNVVGNGGSSPSFANQNPTYNGLPTSTGYFPGQTTANQIFGSPSDQLITGGLRNTTPAGSSTPTIATLTGILTDPNFRVVLHALDQRTGTETLAEPEVVTISGRQTQMRATQILTIITGFNFQQGNGGGSIAPTTGTGTTTP